VFKQRKKGLARRDVYLQARCFPTAWRDAWTKVVQPVVKGPKNEWGSFVLQIHVRAKPEQRVRIGFDGRSETKNSTYPSMLISLRPPPCPTPMQGVSLVWKGARSEWCSHQILRIKSCYR
jgi:hypothetical protein